MHGQLLAAHGPIRESRHETAHRQTWFLSTFVTADMPEATHLAGTIQKWWPEIHGFFQLGITNACTEGCHRVIKQSKRVACSIAIKMTTRGTVCCRALSSGPRDHQRSRTPLKCEEPSNRGRNGNLTRRTSADLGIIQRRDPSKDKPLQI